MGAVTGHVALIRHAKKSGHASARDAEIFAMGVVSSAVLSSYFVGTSLAGLVAGAVAAALLARGLRLPFLGMFDAMFFALPFGWLFLRAGCALIHDHVGVASASPLAVDFPSGRAFDLGVLELLFTPFLIAFTLAQAKKKRAPGVLGSAVGLAFSGLRFLVNFASSDVRFLALTAFQWVCLVAGIGFAALAWLRRNPVPVGADVA